MNNTLSNFVPINRKLFKHEFWEESRAFSRFEAWLDLIASARFDGSEGRKLINGVIIHWQRGQMPVSVRFLAERWGWTKSKVERFIILLRHEKMIKTETPSGTKQTILTICNYETYNGKTSFSGQQSGQPRDDDETTSGQPRDKTNKENIDQKSKERKIYKRFAHLCLFDDEFENLTEAGYTKQQVDDILNEIENYKNNKKYVSLFLTAKNWLQKNCAKKGSAPAGDDVGSNNKPQPTGRVVNIANAFQQALQYG